MKKFLVEFLTKGDNIFFSVSFCLFVYNLWMFFFGEIGHGNYWILLFAIYTRAFTFRWKAIDICINFTHKLLFNKCMTWVFIDKKKRVIFFFRKEINISFCIWKHIFCKRKKKHLILYHNFLTIVIFALNFCKNLLKLFSKRSKHLFSLLLPFFCL